MTPTNKPGTVALPTPTVPSEVTTQTQTTIQQPTSVDGVMIMLFCGLMFYSILLIVTYRLFQGDQMIFAVLSNVMSGFMGAFFLHIKSTK